MPQPLGDLALRGGRRVRHDGAVTDPADVDPADVDPADVDPADIDPADIDEAVFDVVERIPRGRVSTYGAIGRLLGVGPRRVARALSSGGAAVPWHRVVRADGTAAEPVRARQLELLASEGVPARGGRIDLAVHAWPDRDTDVLPRDDGGSSTIVSRGDADGRSRTVG